jgi:putative hemolysin
MYIYPIQIAVIFIFALMSAFFSGSETAFFSLKKSDLHRYSISDKKREKDVYRLMTDPQQILITLLSGSLFVNLAITELSTYMLLNVWDHYGHFISIALVTPLLIISAR